MNENENTSMVLANIPQTSLAEFQAAAFSTPANRLSARSMRAGKTDTVLHIGTQLRTEDIVGHALTIIRVGFASLPATNEKGEPVPKVDENGTVITDENGIPVQETSLFPICHFAEAPGYWYNGGQLLKENIMEWADETGDDLSDYNLPNTNAALQELGGIRCFFSWGESKRTGRRYVKMILA